jgi:group I intron endonuclease
MTELYWVYCIENKINGKKYIGKAKTPKRRWESHLSTSKKETSHHKYIHRAIAKYGANNFWFRCIDYELSEESALAQERHWIGFFNTTNSNFGYNLTLGGEGKSGYKHTPESRRKISESAKRRVGTANPFYGKTHSEETKAKIRTARSR